MKRKSAIADLARSGIGSILGFCCEDDGNTAADKKMLLFKKIRK
jgi:hypothetical protein